MKVALQLFGHLRTFEECAAGLRKNLLDLHDCDVFMHTWDETDFRPKETPENRQILERIRPVDDGLIKELKEMYGLTDISVEHQEPMENEAYSSLLTGGEISVVGLRNMVKSMNAVNRLRNESKKTDNRYDLVVMTRPDIALYSPLDLKKIIAHADRTGLDTENTRFFAYMDPGPKSRSPIVSSHGSDLLFFGSPVVIDRFLSIAGKLTGEFIKKHCITPESILYSTAMEEGLSQIPFSYSHGSEWNIVRGFTRQTGLIKNLISLNVSGSRLRLRLLSVLRKNIFQIQVSLGGVFTAEISLGRPKG